MAGPHPQSTLAASGSLRTGRAIGRRMRLRYAITPSPRIERGNAMTTRLTLGKLLTFAGCIAATPPVVGETLIKVPPIEVHTMKSNRVGDSFEIKVLLPPTIPGEQTRFPVLYMTDVSGEFPNADALRLLMVGDVPRFIAVGIGYPGASGFLQALAMRERDLTPEGTVLSASNAP
jgi:hypothetical protein